MKILVVDDSAVFRRRVRASLERMGVEKVTELASTDQVLAALVDDPAAVVVTGSGREADAMLELVTHIRVEVCTTTILVIVVSQRSLPDDVMRALECGADYYLIDPFSDAQLVQKVWAASNRLQPPDKAEPAVQAA